MVYLILCVLSSTGIFLVFRFLDQHRLPSFPVIIINYLVAAVIGITVNSDQIDISRLMASPWIPVSVLIGFLFIVMFFVIARSSGEAGISITTVASKMSVVFPISFSIFIDHTDNLSWVKALAIIAALTGVLMTIYEPGTSLKAKRKMFIPLVLFVGMGLVDSLVRFAQHNWVRDENTAIFSAVLFIMAFLTGLVILPFRKRGLSEFRKPAIWGWGILLGIVNFGSIYMIVSALNHVNDAGEKLDGSIVFGVNNIGIVSLSVLAGLWIFREKLHRINWAGIIISAIAIILFSFS